MGLLGASMDSLSISSKTRRSSDASAMSAGGGGGGGAGSGSAPEGNENDTSELDQDQGNVLTAIISQCTWRRGSGWSLVLKYYRYNHLMEFTSLPRVD